MNAPLPRTVDPLQRVRDYCRGEQAGIRLALDVHPTHQETARKEALALHALGALGVKRTEAKTLLSIAGDEFADEPDLFLRRLLAAETLLLTIRSWCRRKLRPPTHPLQPRTNQPENQPF